MTEKSIYLYIIPESTRPESTDKMILPTVLMFRNIVINNNTRG